MRTLVSTEVDQVTGGAVNLGTGFAGAGIGGLAMGGSYALNSSMQGNFSWGQFSATVIQGTTSGFLIGSGTMLIVAGATGAIKGATVAGVTLAGSGAALAVASGASSGGPEEGGGSY